MRMATIVPALRRLVGRALGRNVPRGTPPITETHTTLSFRVPVEHAAWYARAIDAITIPPGIEPEIGTIAFVYAAGTGGPMAMIAGQLILAVRDPDAPRIDKREHIIAAMESLGALAGNAAARANAILTHQTPENSEALYQGYMQAAQVSYTEPSISSLTSAEAADQLPPAIFGAMSGRHGKRAGGGGSTPGAPA